MADNSEGIWWDEAGEDAWLNSGEDDSQVIELIGGDRENLRVYGANLASVLADSKRKSLEPWKNAQEAAAD